MMMKRVSAFPTSQNYQGQPEYDLTLHLLLDEKGYPIGKWPTFGNFGSMKNDPDEATEPFILFPNGTMDLGSPNEDLIDRYSKMTLLDGRPVVTERFFEVTYEGKVITYRITQITDLQ